MLYSSLNLVMVHSLYVVDMYMKLFKTLMLMLIK